VFWWQNFENRVRFYEITAMRCWSRFCGHTVYF